MADILIQYFTTGFGELVLGSFEERLCLCDWRYRRMRAAVDTRIQRGLNAAYCEGTSVVMDAAKDQLQQYFAGERTGFDIPLRMVGTDFQQRVWAALLTVPYGASETYASLTGKVAEPTAIRAVASANGANAISIVVPCHRIIGSSGELVGYAGGLTAKKKLLQLENAVSGKREPDLFNALAEA
ncbi:MAG: methylated-DNA--[protein]-cysteine S-methyltransferase [Flavobacteriales bacterium]